MSNPETFIDEVTEEVRRDQLFAILKKWGWVGVVAVVAIVGGASVNEVIKARDTKAAQAAGDAILAALDSETPAQGLDAVVLEGEGQAVLGLMKAAEAAEADEADALLASVANNTTYPVLYRDLAVMKRVLLPGSTLTPDERIALLTPLAEGGDFRVLAEEQLAYALLEKGDTDGARARLEGLMIDADAAETVRTRASDVVVALGGEAQ